MTVVEMLLVILVIGFLALGLFPRLNKTRAQAHVRAARDAFASSHALARQVAAQYGRLARLHLDPAAGRFWITTDTSSAASPSRLDTVQSVVSVPELFAGVTVQGRAQVFCFDPSGVATARGDCDLPNATIIFRHAGVADTVAISRLGRLWKR